MILEIHGRRNHVSMSYSAFHSQCLAQGLIQIHSECLLVARMDGQMDGQLDEWMNIIWDKEV